MRGAAILVLAGAILLGTATPVQAASTPEANLTTASDGFAVAADGQSVEATSTVQVNVVGQSLALMKVPDLQFAPTTAAALIKGNVNLAFMNGAVQKDGEGPGFDGDADEQIVVSDLRGTNSGWVLYAKLDPFQSAVDDTVTITPLSAAFAPSNVQGDNATGMKLSAANFAGNDAAIIQAPQGLGSGVTTGYLTTGSLLLPQTANPLAGQYRAPLNWLLAAVPMF